MKAIQINAPASMQVIEMEKPQAPAAGEVLLRMEYVGFCGSDLNTYLGKNPMVKMPVIPGHEVGAVIEAVERGDIALSRYSSYLSMIEEKKEGKKSCLKVKKIIL